MTIKITKEGIWHIFDSDGRCIVCTPEDFADLIRTIFKNIDKLSIIHRMTSEIFEEIKP